MLICGALDAVVVGLDAGGRIREAHQRNMERTKLLQRLPRHALKPWRGRWTPAARRRGRKDLRDGETTFLRSRYAVFWMRVFTPRGVPIPHPACPRSRQRALEAMMALSSRAGRMKMFTAIAVTVLLVAFADWAVGNTVSLSVLYILPMMLGALVLGPFEIAGLALVCASLRARFDVPSSEAEAILRFAFASLAYCVTGLFVAALVRNRELAVEHLARIEREQELRREAEQQLSVLVGAARRRF